MDYILNSIHIQNVISSSEQFVIGTSSARSDRSEMTQKKLDEIGRLCLNIPGLSKKWFALVLPERLTPECSDFSRAKLCKILCRSGGHK